MIASLLATALLHPPPLARARGARSHPCALCAGAEVIQPPLTGEAAMIDAIRSTGLTEEQAMELWARRPLGKLPGPPRQRALFEWLQTELAARDPVRCAYTCVWREPRLMLFASALPAMRQRRAKLAELCNFPSDEKVADILARYPKFLLTDEKELRGVVDWLKKTTGMSNPQIRQVVASAPNLLLCKREALQSRVDWLRDSLGIEQGGRLSRVVREAPLSLTLSIANTMVPKVQWLQDIGMTQQDVGTLVVRSPRILHTPIAELSRKLDWLQRTGVASGPELAPLLRLQPDYFSLSKAKCEEVFEWLQQQGISASEAAEVLRLEPTILSQKTSELELRATFFRAVLGGTPSDLTSSPQILTCDLGRVVMLRHAFCMSNGLQVDLADLLDKSSARFLEVIGRDELELRTFEEEGKHLTFYQGAVL